MATHAQLLCKRPLFCGYGDAALCSLPLLFVLSSHHDKNLRTAWSAYLDQQHRYPTGIAGQIIGQRMVRQHAPETAWSIDLLNLQPADRVLEIGFGAGQGLVLVLAREPGRVVGVDRSATMIRAATRRNNAALRSGRLTLLRGDVAALPFGMGQFDKIVSIHTFYFWPDPRAVLQQIIGLLTAGGCCVTTFATARTAPGGEREFWPLHAQAAALARAFDQLPLLRATLASGPDSRQFNNVAIVIEKR